MRTMTVVQRGNKKHQEDAAAAAAAAPRPSSSSFKISSRKTTTTVRLSTPIHSPLQNPRQWGSPGGVVNNNEPWWRTVMKMMITISVLGIVTCLVFIIQSALFRWENPSSSLSKKKKIPVRVIIPPPTPIPKKDCQKYPPDNNSTFLLPTNLPPTSTYDAYGISQILPTTNHHFTKNNQPSPFLIEAQRLKQEFAHRYGSFHGTTTTTDSSSSTATTIARSTLSRALTTFGSQSIYDTLPSDTRTLASRFLEAKRRKRPFTMSYAGYSSVTGRGNHHDDSYPFVAKRLLDRVATVLGLGSVRVVNAGVADGTSVPYAWCLEEFLGDEGVVDVVGWDFGPESGVAGDGSEGDSKGFEAWLRHVAVMGERPPMVIVRDAKESKRKRDILESYVTEGVLDDPIVVSTAPAVAPYLELCEDVRPEGLREWDRYGVPNNGPERAQRNPTVREHEFIGWVIAMHLLSALEVVAVELNDGSAKKSKMDEKSGEKISLFPPLTMNDDKDESTTTDNSGSTTPPKKKLSKSLLGLLYGHPTSKTKYTIPPIHCRTTFQPLSSKSFNLESLILSGSTARDVDVTLPRGPMYYADRWVYGMTDRNRKGLQNVNRFGDGGFKDGRMAYFGTGASGVLRLFVPFEGRRGGGGEGGATSSSSSSRLRGGNSTTSTTIAADHFFRNVVLCGVNEVTAEKGCKLSRDLNITLGGLSIVSDAIEEVAVDAATFRNSRLCVGVKVPKGAVVTTRRELMGEVEEEEGVSGSKKKKRRDDDVVGMELNITASRMVMLQKGACSLSHVIWEEVDV